MATRRTRFFSVSSPSWDHTGTRIAAHARWEVEAGVTEWRVVIFSDLWGAVKRQALHTEAQIEAAFGPTTEYAVWEGSSGVSWSPDGEWIAYCVLLIPPDYNNERRLVLVVARVDGSGEIRTLVSVVDSDGRLGWPTWLPDSKTVYFYQVVGGHSHIMSVPAAGGAVRDLSAVTDPNAEDSAPFF